MIAETTKEKIIRKLTSRKFWAALIGFVTQLMIAYGCTESQVAQVSAVIMAGATLIAYIVAEGMVDGSDGVIYVHNTGDPEQPDVEVPFDKI